MTDFKELINKLLPEKIINLMNELGAKEYIETENYIIFPTICHNVDADNAKMKLYYYKNNHIFYCYTECGGMDIFTFLRHYYDLRNLDYTWAELIKTVQKCTNFVDTDNLIAPYQRNENYFLKYKHKDLQIYDDRVLSSFIKYYPPEWLSDGITRRAMDKFNILYSISQNKIIIPHYNVNGDLVGIRGRALNEGDVERFGKYMPVKIEDKLYNHELSLNLYGLNCTKEQIKKSGICFLGESEKFVLQCESFSFPNCSVAVCGSNFNKFQLEILLKECHPKEIVVCFDSEENGNETKYYEKLCKICEKYKQFANFSFIYDTHGLINLKDSPTDKGEEIFKQLLKGRIKI